MRIRAYLDSIPDWASGNLPDDIWFKLNKETEFLDNFKETGYILCEITNGTDQDIITLNAAGLRVEIAA